MQEALRLGFHGYLTKHTEAEQFKRSLASVIDGQTVFPHRLGRRTDPRSASSSATWSSWPRSSRRASARCSSCSRRARRARQIAARLGVSPNTVRTHVQGILSKLQVHSRLEAAAFAVRHELVKART